MLDSGSNVVFAVGDASRRSRDLFTLALNQPKSTDARHTVIRDSMHTAFDDWWGEDPGA